PFDRDALLWRIFSLLGRRDPVLALPAAYLAEDQDRRKRYQLASRLAGLFDDYLLFRADWLRAWERHESVFPDDPASQEHERWQAHLWRACRGASPEAEPLSARLERAVERLAAGRGPFALPHRLTVFGVSSLPPLFLELLRAAALHVPVEICF